MSLELTRESKWNFVTSNGAGLGVGPLAGEAGSITLVEPDSAQQVKFFYAGMGGGMSFGFKLPKIGKIEVKGKGKAGGGNLSSETLPSGGRVYLTTTFKGSELTRRDIGGAIAFVEVTGGLIAGGAAAAMIFGMNPAWVAAAAAAPFLGPSYLWHHALTSASGILVWAGLNVGIQGGVGGAAYLGLMFEGGVQPGRGWRR
jgi:hypothetical protein